MPRRIPIGAPARIASGFARRAFRAHPLLLGIAVLLVPVLGGGYLWLRGSSLVAVEKVTVVGAQGPDAPQVRAALERAARTMTTLDVSDDALLASVRSYPTVRAVSTSTGFPHAVRITVAERPPVAVISAGGRRVGVAADGTVLEGMRPPSDVPVLSTRAATPETAVATPIVRHALALLGAAAPGLRGHLTRFFVGAQGFQADLRGGPAIILGDSQRARAKWVAAARVLGDPGAHGARYIDVRLPERAVAGGLTSGASAATSQSTLSTSG